MLDSFFMHLNRCISHHIWLLSPKLGESVIKALDKQINLRLSLADSCCSCEKGEYWIVISMTAVVDELAALSLGYGLQFPV